MEAQENLTFWARNHRKVLKFAMAVMAAITFWYLAAATFRVVTAVSKFSCDTVQNGYTCSPELSHHWGQYSPFFSVPQDSAPSNAVPDGCSLTFAQSLNRHGARDPTASKTETYNATIQRIKASVTSYGPGYEFLKDWEYTMGADQLTIFGQQQLVHSGQAFYERYEDLASRASPFVRASGQDRVVESARNWTQGFHAAAVSDAYPYNIVIISEEDGSNNTLDHGLCTVFEEGPDSGIGDNAQLIWMDVFLPNITARLNANLPGANLTASETIYLMDMCPFTTVADPQGAIAPGEFCSLFTADEWKSYDYFETLGKFYGYGAGNPLGPTQGVGFANELIARLTGQPVADHTSTNATLNGAAATFPLDRTLYADFSHDNSMTSIFFALGLYNGTGQLSNTTREDDPVALGGYSAAWTVAFAARMYVEKMVCDGDEEELVRVLVNDRVRPLETCGADALGRCTLSNFVESLEFVKKGGEWASCFA